MLNFCAWTEKAYVNSWGKALRKLTDTETSGPFTYSLNKCLKFMHDGVFHLLKFTLFPLTLKFCWKGCGSPNSLYWFWAYTYGLAPIHKIVGHRIPSIEPILLNNFGKDQK